MEIKKAIPIETIAVGERLEPSFLSDIEPRTMVPIIVPTSYRLITLAILWLSK